MLYAIDTLLSMCAMTIAALQGVNWITIGYGLHPLIAFPTAGVCGLLAYWSVRRFVEEMRLTYE